MNDQKPTIETHFGWVVVFACFSINFCIDGIGNSFSSFVDPMTSYFKAESRNQVVWISALALGLYHVISVFVSVFVNRFGYRPVCIFGALVSSLTYFCTIFTTSMMQVIILQGCIGGMFFGCMSLPASVAVSHYFDKRRTLANGISFAGFSSGPIGFAPLVSYLIDKYGWKGANMILAGIILNVCWLGALLRPVKGHKQQKSCKRDDSGAEHHDTIIKPTNDQKEKKVYLHLDLFKDTSFLVLVSAMTFCQHAYYAIFLQLPLLAMDKGIVEEKALFLVPMISACNTLGRIICGALALRIWMVWVYAVTLTLAGITLIITPLATSFNEFIVAACCYGLFSASVFALFASILVEFCGLTKLNSAVAIVNIAGGAVIILGAPVMELIAGAPGSSRGMSFIYAGAHFMLSAGIFCCLKWIK